MFVRFALIVGAFVLSGAAEAPPLAALSKIETGQWVLRSTDKNVPPRLICLGDPRLLLQLQHPGLSCTRFVIANDPTSTTVHYTCPGVGHGQTTIRIETPRLIHIDSQGIAGNTPFNWSIEARKSGLCPATATR